MPSLTRSAYDLELILDDGTTVGLMLDPQRTASGAVIEGAPKSFAWTLTASDADTPLSEQLEAAVTDDWSGGVGVSYTAAEGVYTRTQGAALPAGQAVDVPLPAAGAGPIHAITDFNGDLYVAQFGDATHGGKVWRSVGGTGPLVDSGLVLAPGEYALGFLIFGDGSSGSNEYLYVCSNNLSGLNGRLHRTTDGTIWNSTGAGTFGTRGRYRLAKVFWVTSDGVGAWRMVTISHIREFSYTIPSGDPFLATSWVEGIRVDSVRRLEHLIASRRHVYLAAVGEVFDIDEQGNAKGLTSYSDRLILPGVAGQFDSGDAAVLYLDGYIYCRLGQGVDRIRVDSQEVQDLPGQCAPGWGTPSEHRWSGFTTCLTVDQGYVVAAMWSPTTSRTGIFWGKDKRYFPDVQTRNPLVWYGPEVLTAGNYRVQSLAVSGLSGQMKLWIGAISGPGVPALSWVSLPMAGSPIQDLLGPGLHRYANGAGTGVWQPWCRLYGLPQTYKSRESVKHVFESIVGSRGLTATTKLRQYVRADPAPASLHWPGEPDGPVVTISPVQHVPPLAPVPGARIEERTDFFAPLGASTPAAVPVLELLRTTAWRVAPDHDTWSLRIAYGAGVINRRNGSVDTRSDPDEVTLLLRSAARMGPITVRDLRGLRYRAKVLQVLERTGYANADGTGKTVRATLRLAGVTPLDIT